MIDSDDRISMVARWKAETQAQLARVMNKVRPLEDEKRRLEDRLQALEVLIGSERRQPPSQTCVRKASTLADGVYDTLYASNEPLHYARIYDLLVERGIEVPGKEPKKNLVAHLSRDDRFSRTGTRGVYGLAEWSERQGAEPLETNCSTPTDKDAPPEEEEVIDDHSLWDEEQNL